VEGAVVRAFGSRPRNGASPSRAGNRANLDRVKEGIREILEGDSRVAYAVLFGSSARGRAHSGSDVDIAVGLMSGARLSAGDVGDLVSRLESAAGRPVDLVILDEAPPALAYRVFRDGTELMVRDRTTLVNRKARAILEYLDFRPIEELCTSGVLAAARGRQGRTRLEDRVCPGRGHTNPCGTARGRQKLPGG
jgi:predicted nucleotidyltransferase